MCVCVKGQPWSFIMTSKVQDSFYCHFNHKKLALLEPPVMLIDLDLSNFPVKISWRIMTIMTHHYYETFANVLKFLPSSHCCTHIRRTKMFYVLFGELLLTLLWATTHSSEQAAVSWERNKKENGYHGAVLDDRIIEILSCPYMVTSLFEKKGICTSMQGHVLAVILSLAYVQLVSQFYYWEGNI